MPQKFIIHIGVVDDEKNYILEHFSAGHSRNGACTAYGHALKALMEHYRDQRQIEEGKTTNRKTPRKVPARIAATMPEDPDRVC